VVDLERSFADEHGVALELQGAGAAQIPVDAGKLHQVVQNLVRNAIEAAPKGGQVGVAVELVERSLHIRVSDNGPGMTDDVRARIFEPFFSTKEFGTGMGMSIVHSFVAMHDGRVEIATSPNGTTIDVALPTRHR
jgi:signal transduction histidine kinase